MRGRGEQGKLASGGGISTCQRTVFDREDEDFILIFTFVTSLVPGCVCRGEVVIFRGEVVIFTPIREDCNVTSDFDCS